jgi:two-component system, response regulator YesN
MDNSMICFLQKLLLDTLSINFSYIKPPFYDISCVDIGLRKGLKNTEALYANLIQIIKTIDYNCFYYYSDGYLLNYIFFHPYDGEETIVVGPFLQTQVNKEFLDFIVEKHSLKFNEIESIRTFLYQLPIFSDNIRLTSVLVDIIDYIRPGSTFHTKTLKNDSDHSEELIYTPIDNYMLKAQATENRYKLEEPLLQAIANGDSLEALSITRHFLSMLYEPRINDALRDKKSALYTTNTLFRLGAGRSNVHSIFLHELSGSFVRMINTNNSLSQLDKLHEIMIHEYCLLVKNKARNKYSTLIRNVLNYIDFNLSQQITLSILADYFHISPPYLSKVFKKEMNTTLTNYITDRKIHESLRILTSTNMQIQEIASFVGIPDYNYYTKTFKKIIGCTPSQYRKKLRSM